MSLKINDVDPKSETEIYQGQQQQQQQEEEVLESDSAETGSIFESSESESQSECEVNYNNYDAEAQEWMKKKKALHSRYPSELTDEDVVSLCAHCDKKEPATKADKIRSYLIKLNQSEFDIEEKDYPGYLYGVSSIHPVTCSRELDPEHYVEYENLAKLAIKKYNRTYQTNFEVAEVVRVNRWSGMYRTYYITFNAVDLNLRGSDQSAVLTVCQAAVNENRINRKEKKEVYSCN